MVDAVIEQGPLMADGFEEALIGVGTQFNADVAVYDYTRCLDILVSRDGMTPEDAVEFMEFNVTGAYVGESTPVFVRFDSVAAWREAHGEEDT